MVTDNKITAIDILCIMFCFVFLNLVLYMYDTTFKKKINWGQLFDDIKNSPLKKWLRILSGTGTCES